MDPTGDVSSPVTLETVSVSYEDEINVNWIHGKDDVRLPEILLAPCIHRSNRTKVVK